MWKLSLTDAVLISVAILHLQMLWFWNKNLGMNRSSCLYLIILTHICYELLSKSSRWLRWFWRRRRFRIWLWFWGLNMRCQCNAGKLCLFHYITNNPSSIKPKNWILWTLWQIIIPTTVHVQLSKGLKTCILITTIR